MNICLCGAQAGYPHHLACPEPLYFEPAEPRLGEWNRRFEENLNLLETIETETKPDNKRQEGIALLKAEAQVRRAAGEPWVEVSPVCEMCAYNPCSLKIRWNPEWCPAIVKKETDVHS